MQQHDLLVEVAEKLEFGDLASLRLVCKSFHAAVGDAVVKLMPSVYIQPSQFWTLCSSFRRVTNLHLTDTHRLNSDSLSLLPRLTPNIRHLCLSNCHWLHTRDIRKLAALSCLETLSLASVPIAASPLLPEALRQLNRLSNLDLSMNPVLTGDVLMTVAHLTNLTALYLYSLPADNQRNFSPEVILTHLNDSLWHLKVVFVYVKFHCLRSCGLLQSQNI